MTNSVEIHCLWLHI